MARAYRVQRQTGVELPPQRPVRAHYVVSRKIKARPPPPEPRRTGPRSFAVARDPGRAVVPGGVPRELVQAQPQVRPHSLTVATEVGALGSAATTITMIPADLTKGPRADITEFTIISIDAGIYP